MKTTTERGIPPAHKPKGGAKIMAQELAIFASRYNIAAADAYVLPALFERTAQMVNLPVRAMISRATYDSALGEYLADAAQKVAASDKAAA